jgi:predicted enzyme related to lactoylglutathione lyase
MHKSRLSTFVIDCQTDDLDAAATFWGEALGRAVNAPQAGDDRYRDLACRSAEPLLMVQRVTHASRIHLDIETDDIEAEVARLEALGARRVEKIRTWWVMEAPTGQRFCVVRPQRGELGEDATTWSGDAGPPR